MPQVRVYYNLHKHTYSLQHYIKGRGWRVFKYLSEVYLENVEFKVYETRRQKVLREKVKNVHAYVIGSLMNFEKINNAAIVTYNPYFTNNFVEKTSKKPVKKAKAVLLTYKRKILADLS